MMEQWLLRLLEETTETVARLRKLNNYMATEQFIKLDRINKDLLYEQQRIMSSYVQILGKRIEVSGFEHVLASRLREEN